MNTNFKPVTENFQAYAQICYLSNKNYHNTNSLSEEKFNIIEKVNLDFSSRNEIFHYHNCNNKNDLLIKKLEFFYASVLNLIAIKIKGYLFESVKYRYVGVSRLLFICNDFKICEINFQNLIKKNNCSTIDLILQKHREKLMNTYENYLVSFPKNILKSINSSND